MEYQEALYDQNIFIIRIGLLLAAFLFSVFGILDIWIVPESKYTVWLIRYAFLLPLNLGILFLSFSPLFKKFYQAALLLTTLASSLGITWMIAISQPDELGYHYYYAGLILIILWNHTFTRLSVRYAAIGSVAACVFYNGVAILVHHKITGGFPTKDFPSYLNNNFFLVSAVILGILANYIIEYYQKNLFLQTRDMEKEVEERKKIFHQLLIAKEKSEQATRAKSEFLANMSHEIRTPMNAIIGMTDLAIQQDVSGKLLDYLGVIKTSSHSLLSIINEILDFSKIEAGKLEIESVDFDLSSMIHQVYDMFLIKAGEKGLDYSVVIEEGTPLLLRGDPVRVSQVLTNLISNAVKFTENGSVTVYVKSENQTEHSIDITFSVSDTGIGIPGEKAKYLFEAFKQADGTTTRRFGGTGLGLSISRSLVDLMGGEISLTSEPGAGSTFFFTVPLGLSERTGTEAGRADFQVPGDPDDSLHGLSVLLAEDNEINQKVISEILKQEGILVHIVHDGKQAVEAVQDNTFDLVLMDVQMPNMDGYEATGTIRKTGRFTDLPIIALTANAMKGDREMCIDAGMNDYISKPIAANELFRIIRKWNPRKKA